MKNNIKVTYFCNFYEIFNVSLLSGSSLLLLTLSLFETFHMKHKISVKLAIIAIVFFSIGSSVYLQSQSAIQSELQIENSLAETNIKEGFYLPDVKFVKEMLRSIFNVVSL